MLEALRARLTSSAIDVVGTNAAVDRALQADADVVVAFDTALPKGRSAEGHPALIVLGDDEVAGRLADRAGDAWGVLPRDATGAELRAAVAAVAEGLVVVPPTAARGLARSEGDDDEGPEPLTAREREVLELASHGLSNRDVASSLGISEHTVKFHLASIYGKLGAGSRTDAVRRGLRRGLITL
jgi:DNA-binding NarL/FixJ family response regulator